MKSQTVTIESIASVKGGKRLPIGHEFLTSTTKHPYIRARDIGGGKVEIQEPVYIADSTYQKISRYIVKNNDIVITIVGVNIGDVGIVTEALDGANLTENASKISTKLDVCDPKFLLCQLSTPYNKLKFQQIAAGAAQGKLGLFKIKSFKVILPEIDIQKNIANIYFVYTDLIDTNRRRIQLLEESARLLFREWFVYFRFPGHEKVKTVDGVPVEWKKGLLEDIATVKKGRNITFELAVEGDIPVVGGGLEPTYYHNKANVSAPVITISASGANAGYVNIYDTDIWASDCSYIDKNSTKYIYTLYLRLKSLQTAIFGFQVGAAQPHVYPRDLNRLKLLIAPDDLCAQFEQLVTPIFNLIKHLKSQNQKLAQARDLLLPRLMSGAIEV